MAGSPDGPKTKPHAGQGPTVPASAADETVDLRPAEGSAPAPEGPTYDDLGPLGEGGMGEVRRVWDRQLARPMAMKILKRELGSGGYLARFVEEARYTAQLQHPGVVPVHALGRLPDGRHFFTMAEVRGEPMSAVIAAIHEASDGGWRPTKGGWTFRRLVAAFAQACHAVAYAHSKGVVHRDLKPENIMCGAHAVVQVIDWGLAKAVGDGAHLPDAPAEARTGRRATRVGVVAGTPAYMPPEQAEGRVDAIDARSDTYSLGAVLYELLSGRPPYTGTTGLEVVHAVRRGPPPPLARWTRAGAPLPEELVQICEQAMERTPEDRFAEAGALAAAVEAWLDGARRREAALALVAEAEALNLQCQALEDRAATSRRKAKLLGAGLPTWADETQKQPVWALEDTARAWASEADQLRLRREQLLSAALTRVLDLPEAHAALAADLLEAHRAAEMADDGDAERLVFRLRQHADALPVAHPTRWRCEAYLKGAARLTLRTEPIGATVTLRRFDQGARRWLLRDQQGLGASPVEDVELPMGSYLLELSAPGRALVRYPVHIGREQGWDGAPPGSDDPAPVYLPAPEEVGADACYVPAGPFQSGSRSGGPRVLPAQQVWVDAFVIQRFPVSNRAYVAFLDALVDEGREQEALNHAPAERASARDGSGARVYGRDAAGHFLLVPDADGDIWDAEWPVMLVSARGAWAYANWLSERTGLSWRLPSELEWEKAGRGVDGRNYPWGDWLDPSWCCMRNSQARPLPVTPDRFPVDESVYGVRHMAGNTQEWCLERSALGPEPAVDAGRLVLPPSLRAEDVMLSERTVVRGGSWYGSARDCLLPHRFAPTASYRSPNIGFRLVRSLEGG